MRASTDVTWKLDGRHVCSVWAAPVKLDPDMHVILFLFRGGGATMSFPRHGVTSLLLRQCVSQFRLHLVCYHV